MRGGQSLGFPVGLASGGLLADLFGYSEAFLFAGIVNMAALVIAVFVLPDLTGEADVSKVSGLRALPTILAADIRIPSIASVNFIIRFLYSGVLLSTIVVFLNSTDINLFAFSELGTGGLVMALGAVAVSLMTFLSGRYSDSVTNRAYITIPTIALFALGFGILGTTPTATTVFFAVLMIGAGVGGSNPPLLAYLSDITANDNLGKIGGVYNMFGDLGSTFGPLLALPLVPYIGFRGIYFACVVLAMVAELLVVGSLLGLSSPLIKSDKSSAD
jgi:MFS family permease